MFILDKVLRFSLRTWFRYFSETFFWTLQNKHLFRYECINQLISAYPLGIPNDMSLSETMKCYQISENLIFNYIIFHVYLFLSLIYFSQKFQYSLLSQFEFILVIFKSLLKWFYNVVVNIGNGGYFCGVLFCQGTGFL